MSMKLILYKTLLVSMYGVLFFSAHQTSLHALTANDVIRRVQERFDDVQDITIEMEQIFEWKLAGHTDTVAGVIYLRPDNNFRYETADRIIITDGERVWDYSPPNKQLIIDAYRPDQTAVLPKDFIYTFPKHYNTHYRSEETVNGYKCHRLTLRPKDESLTIAAIDIWIDAKEWLTRQIAWEDINDNLTTYRFQTITLNSNLPQTTFEPPHGTSIRVIDLTTAQ